MLLPCFCMQAIDWKPIYKKYRGQWVALDDDEVTVIASGDSLQEAHDRAVAAGHPKPIMTKMPDNLMPIIGGYGVWL